LKRKVNAALISTICLFFVASVGIGGFIAFKAYGEFAERDGFNVVEWELKHIFNKWLFKIGHLLEDDLSEKEENAILVEYFSVARDIRILEEERLARTDGIDRLPITDADFTRALKEKRERRQKLENRVEDILEGRMTELLEEEGLLLHPPFFSKWRFVFPPVDFEFDQPPLVLVVSPRRNITREYTKLLPGGLTEEEMARMEKEAEEDGMSAVILEINGIATYPTIVRETKTYQGTLELVAHEWLHQHLVFYPLGWNYFKNEELRTLNETAASIAGRELGQLLAERFPLALSPQGYSPSPQYFESIDFRSEMRSLRLLVDELLEQGAVTEAEALMEERRQFFAEHGIFIRKINQAYFAFRSAYAVGPSSIDPIGPKMQRLRSCTDSLGEFVHVVAKITSEKELDRVAAEQCAQANTAPLMERERAFFFLWGGVDALFWSAYAEK